VIEQHRGSIAMASKIGQGTTIIIELPATSAEAEDEVTPSDASKRNA